MLELLAPAGNLDAVIAAVQNGADAVYMGFGDGFNARRSADNFTQESFAKAVRYCHIRGCKVYVTLNTLVGDREMDAAAALAQQASDAGADAILVQDLGLARVLRAALPDIPALAACEEEKLHKLWEGLGYYSRVRNLQKAARIVCEQYGGQLPADYAALRALPGIGDYTAGAIASISFGLAVPAVDGNVLRVFSRLYNDPGVITEPAVKRAFTARVMEHQPPEKAGDYNQALMELGALVCVPNGAPLCEQCPLASLCEARRAGTALELPHKAAPKARRIEPVTVVLAEDAEERFLLQQRPEKGLLAGLWQPLLWEGEALSAEEVCARLEALGLACESIEPLPAAKHIFSHIEWRMSGYSVCVGSAEAPAGCVWASREQLQNEYTLPGAFKAYKKKLGL